MNRYELKNCKIYFSVFNDICILFYFKLQNLFGKKLDTTVIPIGQYCYHVLISNNKKTNKYTYINCPYYVSIINQWNGCKYTGHVTDDFEFGDSCKICDINK